MTCLNQKGRFVKVMALVLVCLLGTMCISAALAEGATTKEGFTVTGPVKGGEHGWAFGAYYGDIGKLGYVEEEYFVEGVAQRYAPENDELSEDGVWTLVPATQEAYKTRFIVRRPIDPAKFNGTVIVEWANVSGGYDISMLNTPGIYEQGFAYVSALTQMNGIYGFEENPQGLIAWDAERYGALSIPDDGLSYDIYTQIARAVGPNRHTNGIDPMGGLEVKKLFALGESQSGSRVLSYANGVQPIEAVFDGIIPALNAGRGTDFEQAVAHVKEGGETKVRNVSAKVREDINCKVFIINSQTESVFMGNLVQPDSENIRSLEVAGASHSSPNLIADVSRRTDRDGLTQKYLQAATRDTNVVDWAYTVEAVFVQIQRWLDEGIAPPSAEPMATEGFAYKLDEHGNALGGIRMPDLEVPTAEYVVDMTKSGLAGYKMPFSPEKLLALYETHGIYVEKVTQAAKAAQEAGLILPYRAEEYIREAEAAPIPSAVAE